MYRIKNILAFLLIPSLLLADNFSIVVENDLPVSDRHYTHGTKFSYLDENVDWVFFGEKGNIIDAGYTLGQYIYSPSDIEQTEVFTNDRPYAGWLYVDASIYSWSSKKLTRFGLELGVVGDGSLSEETQTFIHEITGSQKPMGWSNQIEEAFGFNVIMEQKWKEQVDSFVDIDIIPSVALCAGNVFSFVGVGVMFRMGWNLPNDFGFMKMEPIPRVQKNKLGGYIFCDIDERWVEYNMFLDAEKCETVKYSLEKEDFVTDIQLGVGASIGGFDLVVAENLRSKEFKEQEFDNRFLTLMLNWRF